MEGSIREYARIGLAHFMFWPECMRSTCVMIESLPKLLQRQDIDVIDCCLPYDEGARSKLVPALRNCGKQLGYAIHPFPLDKISLGSVLEHEQGLARLVMRDQIGAAARIGASTFTIASGRDPGREQRDAAKNVFRNFCRWLCGEVAAHNMMVLLEPFDRSFARNFLFGPTAECVELIESLKPQANNLRIQLDIAHVRLSGERFEQAVQTCGKLLGHAASTRQRVVRCSCRSSAKRISGLPGSPDPPAVQELSIVRGPPQPLACARRRVVAGVTRLSCAG